MKLKTKKMYDFTYANSLKKDSIKYLTEYFHNNIDKNSIKSKFDNISGKTGQYFVQDYLFQKRTKRSNRILMPFSHVLSNNLTYDMLESFSNGVTIEFVNNEFFDQLKLPEENQNEVFRILKNKLGSDDDVSAIISIRSTGFSSSAEQRNAYANLIDFMHNNYNIDPVNPNLKEYLVQRKSKNIIKYTGIKNDKWTGFIYCSIKGGQQDTLHLHQKYKINSEDVQLFNPSVEYADEVVSVDVTLVLIYFALHSIHHDKKIKELNSEIDELKLLLNKNNDVDMDKTNREIADKNNYVMQLKEHKKKFSYVKNNIATYLATREYNKINLLYYAQNHMSLKISPGYLTDPIQVLPIKIEDFVIRTICNDSVDLTHQTSVSKNSYVWDDKHKIILSAASPINLFWSKHLSNMMQQDYSLEEYIEHQKHIVTLWEKIEVYSNSDNKK